MSYAKDQGEQIRPSLGFRWSLYVADYTSVMSASQRVTTARDLVVTYATATIKVSMEGQLDRQ